MTRLRLSMRARLDGRCGRHPHRAICVARFLIAAIIALLTAVAAPANPAQAAPQLWLPTPVGERWKVIQGYGCGSHNSWDRYSLDLVHADGKTRGAPVRAAADGTVFVWVGGSGTLILNHSDGFYTMYTHMESAVATGRGTQVKRGDVIGYVGDRGSPGTPHLHFTAFTGHGIAARGRLSVPLSFAEGYSLPEIGGCNQHGGTVMVAGDLEGGANSGINFSTTAEVERWYSSDVTISFSGAGLGRGFSMAWNNDPGGEAPAMPAGVGEAALGTLGEGLHTLYVRGWGADGQQTLATFGPIGLDNTPPQPPERLEKRFKLTTEQSSMLRWKPATDQASGIAGYRVYLGVDPNGTSDWFSSAPEVPTPVLDKGTYLLRAQALDFAGLSSEWVTLGEVVVSDVSDEE